MFFLSIFVKESINAKKKILSGYPLFQGLKTDAILVTSLYIFT